jgi:hypothetical protein
MTGNWTLTPATGDGLTVNIVGGTPTTLGLNVTSALSGTTVGTQEAANIFTLNDSTVDSTGSMVTLQAEYVATATANLGNGIGVLGVATTGANTNSFYGFGVQGLCQASKTATAPTGGTLGGAGQCAGMNINGQLIAGATGYFTLFGAEVNTTVVAALSGSAPKFKAGITIAHNTNDAVRGAALAADGVTAADAALSISSHSATDVGWGNGILFSDIHGHKAFTSSSVLINAAVFNGTTTAVKSFIDLTAYSCSNSYIDFTNFVADCSGNTQILNTSAFGWIGNFSRISSPGDGVILLADHTVNNGFGRLQLGGTTALFPAISHTGAVINFVLANLGGDASITAGNATLSGNLNTATIQIGTVAPTGNNLIQIGVASATGRFIDVRNVASPICNITTSICEAQYGVDNGGGVYAWCLACSSTIFGTAIGVPVDFWANNIKTLSVLPGTVSVADAQVYVRATAASGSTITGGLRVDGGAGIAGAIYGGAEITTGTTAVSTLPVCNAGRKGAHHFVTDSNAAFTAGIGAIVANGGANNVPVVCDGTNWRIG